MIRACRREYLEKSKKTQNLGSNGRIIFRVVGIECADGKCHGVRVLGNA